MQGRPQLFVANTSTIIIAGNPIQPVRNAHVHARYYYVRDLAWDNCSWPTRVARSITHSGNI